MGEKLEHGRQILPIIILLPGSPKNEYILFPFVSAGVCWVVDNFNNVLQSIEIKLDKENS